MGLQLQITEGKCVGNNEYEYLCENCEKVFTSNKNSLVGLERLCDKCFEGYADQMYRDGMANSG